MAEQVNSTDDYSTKKLTISYYNDSKSDNNSYTMYNDDGSTYGAIEKDEFELITFERKYIDEKLTEYYFKNNEGNYNGKPESRNIQMELIGFNKNINLSFELNNKKLNKNKHSNKSIGYYYDNNRNIWIINFEWNGQEMKLKVES